MFFFTLPVSLNVLFLFSFSYRSLYFSYWYFLVISLSHIIWSFYSSFFRFCVCPVFSLLIKGVLKAKRNLRSRWSVPPFLRFCFFCVCFCCLYYSATHLFCQLLFANISILFFFYLSIVKLYIIIQTIQPLQNNKQLSYHRKILYWCKWIFNWGNVFKAFPLFVHSHMLYSANLLRFRILYGHWLSAAPDKLSPDGLQTSLRGWN